MYRFFFSKVKLQTRKIKIYLTVRNIFSNNFFFFTFNLESYFLEFEVFIVILYLKYSISINQLCTLLRSYERSYEIQYILNQIFIHSTLLYILRNSLFNVHKIFWLDVFFIDKYPYIFRLFTEDKISVN